MILLIDHNDSFTANLGHLLSGLAPVTTVQSERVSPSQLAAARILVFSPGPGQPSDYPTSVHIYHSCKTTLPILGVCLGFQLMLVAEGARIIRQPWVLHGVQTSLHIHCADRTYRNIPLTSKVGRYHSLAIEPTSVPPSFHITATDPTSQLPLSFEHATLPLFGLQFHPESFLTDHGHNIVHNILAPYLG